MAESVRNGTADAPGSTDVPDPAANLTRDQAFEEYVVPELGVLLRVATSLTRNLAEAEDLVQDTLVRAYRAVDRFDGRHPRAWLLTILRNTHKNRGRRRRPELMSDPDVDLRRMEAARPAESAETTTMDRQFDAVVEEAFARLPPKMQEIVELVDFDGLSYRDAAEVLGVPVGTVMSRLHRARKRIRRHLETVGFADGRRAGYADQREAT